ncbi:sodium-dependent phosphate transporter 2 [Nilaparvata lugens]|uniref:sodium-dependent phosphate transporter 2 n=1 Tax=Nilaparvata lugens TaxID=108931 RepID=UPI00193CD6BC|nr:sodium-dependent phosphate transporter 2 [Nilaparvata lugens]
MEPYDDNVLALVIACFGVSFLLAFGIGANDVANSFGTSVGAKVLTIFQACCLATVFEIAGSVLIGFRVSDTMRKGILDVSLYEGAEEELMAGCFCCLAGSAVWLIVATYLKLPISGTHSIVGATVGFSLVCRGAAGLRWGTLGFIILSWFVSPILSGLISVVLFLLIKNYILRAADPLHVGFRILPYIYGLTVIVNIFSILHDGSELLAFDRIPLWGAILLSILIGIVSALLVQFLLVPMLRKKILEEALAPRIMVQFSCGSSSDLSKEESLKGAGVVTVSGAGDAVGAAEKGKASTELSSSAGGVLNKHFQAESEPVKDAKDTRADAKNGTHNKDNGVGQNGTNGTAERLPLPELNGQVSPAAGLSPNSSAVPLIKDGSVEPNHNDPATLARDELQEQPEINSIFSILQVLTACFGSFAHGGNDVSNAIGPLIAVWLIFTEGSVLQKSETPLYILLYGGVGISLGLWLWGRRVIQTIGEDLTKITASTGFTIEIGAALTVLLASKIGLPISTTHCKVGSVVFVGFTRSSKSGVEEALQKIIYAWVVTVPATALLSAIFMFGFKALGY